METEIKLGLVSDDLAKIVGLDCVTRHAKEPARTCTIKTYYYDTPEKDLVRRRVWVRTREIDGHWVQTVKMAGGAAGGLHQRFEHEVPISGPDPDIKALPDIKGLTFLSKKSLWKSLQPLIQTEFQRTIWDLELEDGTRVEFVADSGQVCAAGRSRPLCELELELKSGRTTAMMRLARTIAEDVDVWLDCISKAHKGLLLIENRMPEPVFANAHIVAPDATLVALAQSGIIACVDQIQGNIEPILVSSDIEGVHQMRVGLRRLRAAIWGFKKGLPGLKRPAFYADLQWLLSLLAPARELDVMISTCLTRLDGLSTPPEGIALLRASATARQKEAYAALREALCSPRCRRLMLDLLLWAHEADWGGNRKWGDVTAAGSAGDYARSQLRRGHRRILNAGADIEELGEAELHELRLMVKRQRYTSEFVAPLFKTSPVAYLKALKRLQGELGIIQDTHVVPQSAARLVGDAAPVTLFLRGWCAHAANDAHHDLMRRWGAFEEAKRFWKD